MLIFQVNFHFLTYLVALAINCKTLQALLKYQQYCLQVYKSVTYTMYASSATKLSTTKKQRNSNL
jgi:hypothetical protein